MKEDISRQQRENINFNEMEQWLNQKGVTEIECLVPDMTGSPRGKILPRAKFREERGMRLPEIVLGMTVTGEYPEDDDFYEVIDHRDHDMILKPDASTVRIVPWATDPTAEVIHDCFTFDNELVDYAPRSVLHNILSLYEAKGWRPVVAPELEFYLLERNTDPNLPLKPPIGRSGRAESGRQSYSIDAVNEFDPLFEDIYDYCEKQELEIDTLIHEMGAGQMEINFLHGNPMELADSVFLFKRTVREAALRHNMYATFMAKPMGDQPGSAMHVHNSVVDIKTGKNIFSTDEGKDTDLFRWALGGLQKYAPASMAFFAPYVNSYRRLAVNTAAPVNVLWGRDNRTVGFRIPHSNPAGRRVENRLIGADVNPYIAIAATLACTYLGMTQQIEATPETETDGYKSGHTLPISLTDSVELLRACKPLHDVMGKRFVTIYAALKQLEHQEFMRVISPWERQHLLLLV